MKYLKIPRISLDFKREEFSKLLTAKHQGWTITLMDGIMPDAGEGFVDMVHESGALDYLL